MSDDQLDRMIEYSVNVLATENPKQIGSLVRDLATKWPSQPASAIAFALTSAASSLEDMIETDERSFGTVLRAYKLAALVAADIFALEQMGIYPSTGADLLHFWRRVDPYFLHL